MVKIHRDSYAELEELYQGERLRVLTASEARRWAGTEDHAAAQFVEHVSYYPHQDAGVNLALVEAGIRPTDDAAVELSGATAHARAERSMSLLEQKYNNAPPDSAMFDETEQGQRNFIGYETLTSEENDFIVNEMEVAIASGEFTREELNTAVESGQFSPQQLLDYREDTLYPYQRVLMALADDTTGEVGNPELEGIIRNAPLDKVREISNSIDIWEQRWYGEDWSEAPGDNGVRPAGTPQVPRSFALMEVRRIVQSDDDLRRIEWESDVTPEVDFSVAKAVREARLQRGEVEGIGKEAVDTGLFSRVGGFVETGLKFGTRGSVAALGFMPQLFTNRVRQDVGALGYGLEAGIGRSRIDSPSLLQTPTFSNPLPVTQEGMAAAEAASGVGGLMTTAAAYGMPHRGSMALIPEILPGSAGTPRQLERARATDLGVLLSNPELQGDGFLLSQDHVALRQSREAALAPALDNGQLLTIGRSVPAMFGVDLDSRTARYVSGAVDFAVALAGPGEVLGDAAIKAGLQGPRFLRGAPAIRDIRVIGRVNPFQQDHLIHSSWRNRLWRPDAEDWINGEQGRKLAEELTLDRYNTTSQVRRAFGDNISVARARSIAASTDVDEIHDMLRTGVSRLPGGGDISQAPRRGITGHIAHTSPRSSFVNRTWLHVPYTWGRRLAADMPDSGGVQLANLDDAWEKSELLLRNANVPAEKVDEILNGLADTSPLGRSKYFTEEVMGEVNRRVWEGEMLRQAPMKGRKIPQSAIDKGKEFADNVTRLWNKEHEDLRAFFIDDLANDVPNPLTRTTDGMVDTGGPLLTVEAHIGWVNTPGLHAMRDIRRMTKPSNQVLFRLPGSKIGNGMIDGTVKGLGYLTSSLWKPLVLLRPAYVMRVISEEQLRIATAGGDALVNNPLGWASWVMGRGGRSDDIINRVGQGDVRSVMDQLDLASDTVKLDDLVERVDRADGIISGDDLNDLLRGAADDAGEVAATDVQRILNERFVDPTGLDESAWQYRQAMVGAVRHTDQVQWSARTTYEIARKGQDDFYTQAWAGELSQLAADPVAARIAADGGVTDDLIDELMNAPKWESTRQALINMTTGEDLAWSITVRSDVEDYLDTVNRRIEIKTRGNADLQTAIATGRFRGEVPVRSTNGSAMLADQGFIDAIEELVPEFGPERVKSLRVMSDPQAAQQAETGFRNLLDRLGHAIIEWPTSKLSRSPVFRENYWNFVSRYADEMDPNDARRLVDEIPEGLPRDMRRTIKWRLGQADGAFSLEEFDAVAKADAMERTNDLLFSMATKSQWADSLRIVAPFAEAWAEILTTWARLIPSNPQAIRRFSQARTVINDPDFVQSLSEIPGMDVIDGQGLMFTNDWGDEVVVIPWANAAESMARWGARQIPFVDAPAEMPGGLPPQVMPVQSLNIGASIIPGIGPAVAVPLNFFLVHLHRQGGPDILGTEIVGDLEVREILQPFGAPTTAVSTDALNEFLPSWMRYGSRVAQSQFQDFGSQEERDAYYGRVIMAAKWLLANKPNDYPLAEGPDAMRRLFEDATDTASGIGTASAIQSFIGFGPSQPTYVIYDDDGNVQLNTDDPDSGTFMTTLTLGNLQRIYLDEALDNGMSYEDAEMAAWAKTLDATGTAGAPFSAIGVTVSRGPGGAPTSKAAWDWLQENREASQVGNAQLTWGVFAPEPNSEDDFYMPMYLETIQMGDRERLSNEDWQRLAENQLGDWLYGTVELEVNAQYGGDIPDQVAVDLDLYARSLNERLPGWGGRPEQQVDTIDAINELARVTSEGEYFADHELAEPIQLIESERQRIDQFLIENGYSSSENNPMGSAKGVEPVRQAYNDFLDRIVREYPQAEYVVTRFYRRAIQPGLDKDAGVDD